MLSTRVGNISPSATLAIDAKAKQLKKEGKDIVIFGAGEPDFNTPENIKEAAISAIRNNITRYTPVGGVPELKKAIAEKFKRFNKINYDVSEVTTGCGGKHILYNAMMSVLEEGDEAILPVPYWVSFDEMIKLAGAKTVFCNTDSKFRLTAKDVEQKITEKTKLLILNSPSNPSGAVVDTGEISKIAELAVKHNFFVISDEVYEYFVYGNNKFVSIASLNDSIKKLTITVNAVSKTYAMTGWRIGYCGASKEVIKSMENLQSHSTSNPTSIAQMAALEAINGPQDSVSKMVEAFDERREFMHKRLNEIRGLSCVKPRGAFYAYPRIEFPVESDRDFVISLLKETGVLAVYGEGFGQKPGTHHFRVVFLPPEETLAEAYDKIEGFIKENYLK